ncbi:MAG: hydrogenase maturation nickel metallochaperone HypA [Limisphaerales bacterium]
MHEVGIAQNALEQAIKAAQAAGATRIHNLLLRVGVMSGVVPEALVFAFEAVCHGTMAEGAALKVELVPVVCWCENCRIEFSSPEMLYECPQCRQFNTRLRRGLELELASLEAS